GWKRRAGGWSRPPRAATRKHSFAWATSSRAPGAATVTPPSARRAPSWCGRWTRSAPPPPRATPPPRRHGPCGVQSPAGLKGKGRAMPLVLTIDDDPNVHRLLGAVFRGTPFTLVTALTAEQGLDLLSRQRPDVVLLDVNMPGVTGIEALKRL